MKGPLSLNFQEAGIKEDIRGGRGNLHSCKGREKKGKNFISNGGGQIRRASHSHEVWRGGLSPFFSKRGRGEEEKGP